MTFLRCARAVGLIRAGNCCPSPKEFTAKSNFKVEIAPRFDYGDVRPWINRCNDNDYTAVASNDGLVISGNMPLALNGRHDLTARFAVRTKERTFDLVLPARIARPAAYGFSEAS